MSRFEQYSEKFLNLSLREQSLLLITGIIAIVFVSFSLFIDKPLAEIVRLGELNQQLTNANHTTEISINELSFALKQNPDDRISKEIAEYERKLSSLDQSLLSLTNELISPIDMRNALIELLNIKKGIVLQSFEVFPVEKIDLTDSKKETDDKKIKQSQPTKVDTIESLALYRHGIKITLKGQYFSLRDYLKQVEQLPWKFYWQKFDYQLKQYPNSELTIEMYSLSTKQEFIGV